MSDLLTVFNQQWRQVQADIAALRQDVDRALRMERAEVAGADAVYDTMDDLPDGFLGARATVADDGTGNPAPLWHDGSAWRKVTFT